MIDLVTNKNFSTIDELIWCAIHAVNEFENEESESVKLFGNSDTMYEILKKLIVDPQYGFIKIGCIDWSANWFDQNKKDDYVLEINDNYEVCIQSAWNGDQILKHESKYIICLVSICSNDLLKSLVAENVPLFVAEIS